MLKKSQSLPFIIMLISLLAVAWFMIPFVLYGIINIGNGTGIIVFSCFFIYGIKMNKINIWIKEKSKGLAGKIVFGILGLLSAVIFILVFSFSILMMKTANQIPSGNSTVVVLGCRVYGERASLMLMERLDAAYEYLIENDEALCILSGGQGKGEDITEAECMYRYLTEKGISPERLFKEEKSTSTRENLDFSQEIIKEKNLKNDIAIVTNEFHEYRAGRIAKTLNLKSYAIPARTAWWLFPTYYVRELYGIIYEIIL